MKFFYRTLLAVAIALFSLVAVMRAANSTNTPTARAAGAKSTSGANLVINTSYLPEEMPIPRSVFDVTVKPSRDPFFPLSRRQPIEQLTTNATLAFSANSFSLKGLTGSVGHPLALINNRTVAPGEEVEINTANGRIKIHCLAIKNSSIVLSIPTQIDPIEVYLRKTAQ